MSRVNMGLASLDTRGKCWLADGQPCSNGGQCRADKGGRCPEAEARRWGHSPVNDRPRDTAREAERKDLLRRVRGLPAAAPAVATPPRAPQASPPRPPDAPPDADPTLANLTSDERQHLEELRRSFPYRDDDAHLAAIARARAEARRDFSERYGRMLDRARELDACYAARDSRELSARLLGAQAPPAAAQLSEVELEVCQRRGLTPEEFLAAKQRHGGI